MNFFSFQLKSIFDCNAFSCISCSPNLNRHWDTPSFSSSLFACRAIKKGEELTLSYMNVLQSARKRKQDLKRMYNIDSCGCCSCSASSTTASDQLRQRMLHSDLAEKFHSWMKRSAKFKNAEKKKRESKIILALIGSDLDDIVNEGLESLYERHYNALRMKFDVYVCLGDEENAMKVGEAIGRQQEAVTGSDAVKMYMGDSANLKKNELWETRK